MEVLLKQGEAQVTTNQAAYMCKVNRSKTRSRQEVVKISKIKQEAAGNKLLVLVPLLLQLTKYEIQTL